MKIDWKIFLLIFLGLLMICETILALNNKEPLMRLCVGSEKYCDE